MLSPNFLKQNCTTINRTKQAHAFLLRTQLFNQNLFISKLLNFLAVFDSGDLNYATKIFAQIQNPDSFIYNTMIRGYAKTGNHDQAFSFYNLMLRSGVSPDNHTYPFLFMAFARSRTLELGLRFHCEVLKKGFCFDLFVVNSLIQFYGNCGCFESACNVFDKSSVRDVVTWNVMLNVYIDRRLYAQAFSLFEDMMKLDYIRPDNVTLLRLITASTQLGDLEFGNGLVCYAQHIGVDNDVSVGNAILDMYCKCGDLELARQWFDSLPKKDVCSWTILLSGLTRMGYFRESLVLFREMQVENVKPDEITLVSVLSCCAQTGALDQGKYIHLLVDRSGINRDIVLESALVDMYAKCGSIDFALQVFDEMRDRNIFSWNSMIGGLAMHGRGEEAISLFIRMKRDKVVPDDVTFIALLCACSHANLVDEGHVFFQEMKENYRIEPRMEHYGCMVDLLCRSRLVNDALSFIENMPIMANSVLWATLLEASRRCGDFQLAEKVGKRVIELEPDSCGRYVMVSNLYADTKKWNNASNIRKQMKSKGIEKTPGCSWIELNGTIHQFVAGDRSHFQSDHIYSMIEEMTLKINFDGGYVSAVGNVLFDIEDEEKEHSLFFHSEKLAVAYGLMSTSPGSPIRITKNLRVCSDCHLFLKLISKIYNREIVARDRNRFHHFSDGSCSCMDFW